MRSSGKLVHCALSTHLKETLVQGILCDVKHLWAVHTAVVVHLLDDEPKGEGRDVQHVEQRGLAGSHLISRLDQLHIAQDFNGSWKERGLLRTQTSVLGWHRTQDLTKGPPSTERKRTESLN